MSQIAVVYWSGSGNTEKMAQAIAKGIEGVEKEVKLFHVGDFNDQDIEQYDRIAFGCPSMGCEELEESEFAPFFESVEAKLQGKLVALFGSYGWGNGEWMHDWEERVKSNQANLFEQGLILRDAPDQEGEEVCNAFGERFAK
ncbi:flavodoxin [Anaerosinus massiliensis]|uniref:flavodoxin n=1 Tax=Massilibacillus massiliensis TaxID=1806837 RepID=UPI000AC6FF2C|nr:flavodoxin [Massilibacillus massiliensis]